MVCAIQLRPAVVAAMSAAAVLSLGAASASAATCPFDAGASDALNDGVVLTRYALDIRGAPLTASTRYASLDPLQVKNNIECVGCALDMNGDGQIDTVDTTIIARHLVGFKSAALTNGLALGAGSRNTTAAVTSFLANGCAVGGAISAFTQGGNAFGVPAVLGTTDGQPLTLGIGGGAGVRIVPSTTVGEPNIIGGHADNSVSSTAVKGAFIGGGGVPGGYSHTVSANYGTIGGGLNHRIAGDYGVVGGGVSNAASGSQATIGGGYLNTAAGVSGTVPGGFYNRADGANSFAAGGRAKAVHDYSFVWNGHPTLETYSVGPGSFVVYAPGSINMYTGAAGSGGCFLSVPANGWACFSDRALKTNIRPLNALDVLKRVVSMPVSSWSFKGAEPFTHIGPMAQDFTKAFGLGGDDKTISAMDSAGVALAAIQGLNQIVKDRDGEIAKLKSRLAAIEQRLGVK